MWSAVANRLLPPPLSLLLSARHDHSIRAQLKTAPLAASPNPPLVHQQDTRDCGRDAISMLLDPRFPAAALQRRGIVQRPFWNATAFCTHRNHRHSTTSCVARRTCRRLLPRLGLAAVLSLGEPGGPLSGRCTALSRLILASKDLRRGHQLQCAHSAAHDTHHEGVTMLQEALQAVCCECEGTPNHGAPMRRAGSGLWKLVKGLRHVWSKPSDRG